jgi:hypothetical protein
MKSKHLFSEMSWQIHNLFNTTSGGVQLKVSENDFGKANQLMNEFYNTDN